MKLTLEDQKVSRAMRAIQTANFIIIGGLGLVLEQNVWLRTGRPDQEVVRFILKNGVMVRLTERTLSEADFFPLAGLIACQDEAGCIWNLRLLTTIPYTNW